MAEWAIETDGLTKHYGYRQVLSGIDLHVKWGEFCVLLGPNGVGKSTLMHILCTLSKPSGGRAKVAGYDIQANPDDVRANIGLMAHSTYLYEDLTAEENIRFYLRLRGAPAIEQRTDDALKAAGLAPVRQYRVRTFSTGMKKRLCLAKIMAYPARVLFLDEPYSGLDEQGIGLLNRFLGALKSEGCTLLMVTHFREQGVAAGDRVLYLREGKLCLEQPWLESP
jgi:heme exporter protein A